MRKSMALAAALLLAACGDSTNDEEPLPPTAAVYRGVPVLPLATIVDQSGTAQAAQTRLFSPVNTDSGAAWYRRELIRTGWRIEGDQQEPGGTITLHATRGTQPLWVILRPNGQVRGTELTLIGALVDSTQLAAAAVDSSLVATDTTIE